MRFPMYIYIGKYVFFLITKNLPSPDNKFLLHTVGGWSNRKIEKVKKNY